MDIELLNFCHLVIEQNPIRKKIFQDVGCGTLMKYGVKGFRSTTWWSNSICRARLAAIFGKNEKAYNTAMSMPTAKAKNGDQADAEPDPLTMLARELRDRFGAPFPEPIDREAEKKVFNDLSDWMMSRRDDEAVATLCREKLREINPWELAWVYLNGCNDNTAAEFADYFWPRVGPALYYYCPEFQAIEAALPIPEAIKDRFAAPAAVLATEAASVAETTAGTTAKPPVVASVKPADVSALAKLFRDERTPELCRAIIDGLTAKGYFAAAEDYSLQLTYLVSDEEASEEAAYRYLLAVARNEGRSPRLTEEVKAFREDFPASQLLAALDAELDQCAATAASLRTKLFDRWASKVRFRQQPAENQAKLIRRGGNALLAADKIDALEFFLESLKQVPDNGSTRQMLSQAQAYLRLTAPGVETLKDIAGSETSSNAVEDAWTRLVDCLMADGRVEEAKAEFAEMKRQRVGQNHLEYLQVRYAPVWDGVKTPAPKAAPKAAPLPAAPKAPVKPAAPQARPQVGAAVYRAETMRSGSRPDVAALPYPRRFIGAVKHFNNYVNFHPCHVQAGKTWLQLTPSERTTLFPKWGGLALRFANAAMAASLKEGHLFVAEFERSDFLPTQDPNYQYAVEDPKIGQQLKPLSSLGCVIVTPCEEDFDLTRDTFVKLDDSDEAAVTALDGEQALIETKEGLVGPFRLRVNSLHSLYVAKVPMKDLGDVTVWHPARGDCIVRLVLGDRADRTVFCRFALTEEAKAFAKGTTDLVKEEALLQALVREMPQLPVVRDLDQVLARSSLLAKGDRLERVQRMFADFEKTGVFVAGVKETAVACVLERLKKEASLEVRPVTEAVIEALNRSPELARLTETLRGEMAKLRAEHETALTEENARFQSKLRELEQTVEAKEAESKALDGELKAKKDFFEKEIRRVVADAKTDYSRHKLSPYFDGLEALDGTSGAAPAAKTAAGGVDFAARAREAGALVGAASGTPAALRRHLIDAFRARRGYTHDETVNLFVSLANNFLTLFSGEPGCGKTSACGILADALGLTDLASRLSDAPAWQGAASCDRFLAVPVERGWTSKRDFLGYFNPLTQSFSASDRRRYEAFRLLSEEAGSPDAFPFVFLLDEANLSPMEYYWADFMGICGGDARASREIVLGDSVLCRIPDHLRFLATVNIDDTTEPLSPRLLDRAWIIRLPDPEFNPAAVSGAEPVAVRWKDFTAAFGVSGPVVDVKEMQPYYEHMRAMGLTVSMRSRRAIAQFIAVGTPLFDGGLATAVDYAVAQKLLPMVRGSGAAFQAWLEAFRALCDKAPVSAGIVDHILTRGGSNLNFFQFF